MFVDEMNCSGIRVGMEVISKKDGMNKLQVLSSVIQPMLSRGIQLSYLPILLHFLLPPLIPLHPHYNLHPRNNNTRILSIGQHSNFLQRRVLRLHIQPPNCHTLQHQHYNIHHVKFPTQRRDADAIDILVKHSRERGEDEAQREPFCADGVREDFDGVGDCQAGSEEVFDANEHSIVPEIRDIGNALLDELRTGSHGRTLQVSINLDQLLAKLENLDLRPMVQIPDI
jgi:hypothetical protein